MPRTDYGLPLALDPENPARASARPYWLAERQGGGAAVSFPGSTPLLILSQGEASEPSCAVFETTIVGFTGDDDVEDSRVLVDLEWGNDRGRMFATVDVGQSVCLPWSRGLLASLRTVGESRSGARVASIRYSLCTGTRSNQRPVHFTDFPAARGNAGALGPWPVPPFATAMVLASTYDWSTAAIDITAALSSGGAVVQRQRLGGGGIVQSRVELVSSARTLDVTVTGATGVQPIWELAI